VTLEACEAARSKLRDEGTGILLNWKNQMDPFGVSYAASKCAAFGEVHPPATP
jgi:hypothetical protein